VSVNGRSPVPRGHTGCGVYECDWKPQESGGLGPLALSNHDEIKIYKTLRFTRHATTTT
jgi:hypothetical protein